MYRRRVLLVYALIDDDDDDTDEIKSNSKFGSLQIAQSSTNNRKPYLCADENWRIHLKWKLFNLLVYITTHVLRKQS